MTRERIRLALACLATLALVAPLAWMWQQSRMPAVYSVMDMGYADYGGGPRPDGGHDMAGHGSGHGSDHGSGHGTAAGGAGPTGLSVADLVADPDRRADVQVDLVARQERVELASGQVLDGYTLNGTSPGPEIEATEGQLVQVRVRNEDVAAGITLHWHGVDVPNAEDGVAGVTQDAVRPGESHTYRFVADQPGTYWYHSHQVSHVQVQRGLLGPLVVRPKQPTGEDVDVVTLSHTYAGVATLDGRTGDVPVAAEPGDTVRVRVVNSDNGPVRVWTDGPARVVAVDATEVHEPTEFRDRAVTLTAGGRVDLEVVAPEDGGAVRVQVGGATAMVVGGAGTTAPAAPEPADDLDLLSYGSPAPLGFDPDDADRRFRYDIGRRPGFVHGKPGLWWTVNGHLFPDMPMFVVAEGDVVRVRISNDSGEVHPMHLHGHHAVVLARDGKPATGSPWWFDSLNVEDGETFDVAFVADNPGIWMDHCHNLKHAQQGLVTHLMYAGVSAPYRIGGRAGNEPE